VSVIKFAIPVLGIYICSPLMSLVDTAFVGAYSSVELAALSPGTVLCDLSLFLFTFLTAATTGLVANAMAKAHTQTQHANANNDGEGDSEGESKAEARKVVHVCLWTALACGILLTALLEFATVPLLKLVGLKDMAILHAATTYVRIRGFALPLQLAAMVCNAVSIGVRDTASPLKITLLSSALNLVGDFVMCSVLGCGIAGAAWATTASLWVYQVRVYPPP
jgi:Na+-driven multidrug efflux pump